MQANKGYLDLNYRNDVCFNADSETGYVGFRNIILIPSMVPCQI